MFVLATPGWKMEACVASGSDKIWERGRDETVSWRDKTISRLQGGPAQTFSCTREFSFPGRELSQRDREFSSRVREFGTASREFSLRAREFASLPRELAFAAREFSSPAREFGSIPRGFSQRSRGPRSKVRGDAGKTGERRAAFRGWADRPGFGGGGAGPGWTSR